VPRRDAAARCRAQGLAAVGVRDTRTGRGGGVAQHHRVRRTLDAVAKPRRFAATLARGKADRHRSGGLRLMRAGAARERRAGAEVKLYKPVLVRDSRGCLHRQQRWRGHCLSCSLSTQSMSCIPAARAARAAAALLPLLAALIRRGVSTNAAAHEHSLYHPASHRGARVTECGQVGTALTQSQEAALRGWRSGRA
jgi:hypothetical protein